LLIPLFLGSISCSRPPREGVWDVVVESLKIFRSTLMLD
jgi:hypothetical protein